MSTRLIIAVDYDGTIANTNAEAVKWIKTHMGRDVEAWQCDRTDCVSLIGKSPYEEMNDYVYERESTLAAVEVPGGANAFVPSQSLEMCSSLLTDRCVALPTLESGSSEWILRFPSGRS